MLKWLLVFLLASCGMQENGHDLNATAPQKQGVAQAAQTYVQGQLLLVFNPAVTEQQARASITGLGGSIIRVIPKQRFYQIQLPKGLSAQDEKMRYQYLSGVESVGFNYKRRMR